MILSNLAIKRTTTVFVLLLLIFLAGTYSYIVLPRESNPDITIPIINVTTTYEGVAPEDIESLITIPIERELASLSGIKEMQSTSVEGASVISVEFNPDVLIEDSMQKVRDKVDLAKPDIPEEADDPVVTEINLSEFPVLMLSLKGDYPLSFLNTIAEDIEDELESINGVLDVAVIGGVEREIQIEVDPQRVTQYGVSFADLIAITQMENTNVPGGALDLGEAKFLMRTPGEFTSPTELENLIVKQGPRGNVYMRDIATIRDGFKEPDSISRVNGVQAVTLTVSKRSGENIIRVTDDVKAALQVMNEQVLPDDVEVATTWDESVYIRDMVAELENGILSGLILIVIVIFAFLGFVNALFVALAIPVSMLLSFAILNMCGVTLNMVVLFSLILALGMLVDNGIVVVENIYRHMQSGLSRAEAAKAGAAEVAWPIIASTMTTVAAFCPMFFWPGIWGEFMIYLPATVSLALLASLFVGLVVNPALTSVLMPKPRDMREFEPGPQHPVLRLYGRFLHIALRWRSVTVTLAVMMLVVIVSIFGIVGSSEFTPDVEPPQAFIDVDCPQGTNLATSDEVVTEVEAIVAPHEQNIEHVIANVGSQGNELMGEQSAGTTSHLSRITLDFPKLNEAEVMPTTIINAVRKRLGEIVGAEARIEKMDMGPPTGPPVNVEISGDDFATLATLAEAVRLTIRDVPGLVDLRDDYDKGKPEVRVNVDRQQARRAGLNTQFIGLAVKAAVNGRKAGDYREGDEEYDVTIRFPKSFREDLSNIDDMTLVNLAGQPVPFSAVASLEQGAGYGSIKRIDRKRTVTVSAEVEEGMNAINVLADVQKSLAGFPLPPAYTISYTGENEDTEETMAFLGRAFIVAVFLIALVLVTQFNSITQPLIILTSVILSLAGVFLGLIILNRPFSIMMGGIGCISLAGVVVNNGIVLIDFINQLRAKGLSVHDAIIEASTTRFRPVLLTAVTTVLGLVPMAVGVTFDFRHFRWIIGGESSQWWGPMATAVIFGLSFATVLTLVVVPVLYSLTDSLSHVFQGLKKRKGASPEAAAESLGS